MLYVFRNEYILLKLGIIYIFLFYLAIIYLSTVIIHCLEILNYYRDS